MSAEDQPQQPRILGGTRWNQRRPQRPTRCGWCSAHPAALRGKSSHRARILAWHGRANPDALIHPLPFPCPKFPCPTRPHSRSAASRPPRPAAAVRAGGLSLGSFPLCVPSDLCGVPLRGPTIGAFPENTAEIGRNAERGRADAHAPRTHCGDRPSFTPHLCRPTRWDGRRDEGDAARRCQREGRSALRTGGPRARAPGAPEHRSHPRPRHQHAGPAFLHDEKRHRGDPALRMSDVPVGAGKRDLFGHLGLATLPP